MSQLLLNIWKIKINNIKRTLQIFCNSPFSILSKLMPFLLYLFFKISFIDNILFRGYLYKESPKRFKTIVKRLDEFIDYLYENFDFVLLPISDGVGLVYKK